MRTLGNVVWFIVAGLGLALTYVLAGIICCAITIIGIPFALASLRMATLAVAPFGKVVVPTSQVGGRRAIVSL